MTEADKLWVKNNKEKVRKSSRDWCSRNPWRRSYDCALNRCKKHPIYIRNGIKFLMKVSDFKYIWYRDKAWFLQRPSVDRIDPRGDYAIENCRFIEFIENVRRKKLAGWFKFKSCSLCGDNKEPHYSLRMWFFIIST